MTEDSRISEIRAVLAKFEATDAAWPLMQEVPAVSALVGDLGTILDRPVPADEPEPVDWPAVAEAFADEIAELSPPVSPAPRVFFPGEMIPGGMATQNVFGTITHCGMSLQSSTVEVRLRTAAHRLSSEEWQAAVDRARAERDNGRPA